MFEAVGRQQDSLGRWRAALVVAILAAGATFCGWGRHYFISAFFVGVAGAVFHQARWLLALACLECGVGSGLTPHRTDFANMGDVFLIASIYLLLVVTTILLLCFKVTRRTGRWLLLGLVLLPSGCSGTMAIRRAVHDTTVP